MLILSSIEIGLEKKITVAEGFSGPAGHCTCIGTSSITVTHLNMFVHGVNLPLTANRTPPECMSLWLFERKPRTLGKHIKLVNRTNKANT